MHNAPSVVYPVGRCAFQGWMLVLLGGVTAGVGFLFLLESHAQVRGFWTWSSNLAGAIGWVAWVTWAFVCWRRSPQGELHWNPPHVDGDGVSGAWSWIDPVSAEPLALSRVEDVLDLQDWVLLHITGPGVSGRWLWVEQRAFPARWLGLRRALVSSRA